jgi:hypothetical protein
LRDRSAAIQQVVEEKPGSTIRDWLGSRLARSQAEQAQADEGLRRDLAE